MDLRDMLHWTAEEIARYRASLAESRVAPDTTWAKIETNLNHTLPALRRDDRSVARGIDR